MYRIVRHLQDFAWQNFVEKYVHIYAEAPLIFGKVNKQCDGNDTPN